MNEAAAIKKLQKVLGTKFAYRVNAKALDADGREKAAQDRKAAGVIKVQAIRAMEERQKALLAGDAEYQRLRAEVSAAQITCNDLNAKAFGYRITVGTTSSVAGMGIFSVQAQGDNWEDVVAQVESKKVTA